MAVSSTAVLRKEEAGGCCGPKRGPPIQVAVNGDTLWLGTQGPISVSTSVHEISAGKDYVSFRIDLGKPVRYTGQGAAGVGQAMTAILSKPPAAAAAPAIRSSQRSSVRSSYNNVAQDAAYVDSGEYGYHDDHDDAGDYGYNGEDAGQHGGFTGGDGNDFGVEARDTYEAGGGEAQDVSEQPQKDSKTEEVAGEDLINEVYDLVSVYHAMKVDYVSALSRKAEAEAAGTSTKQTEESIGIILMGRKSLCQDLEYYTHQLEWELEHTTSDTGSEAVRQAKVCLAEDETFNAGHSIDAKTAQKTVRRSQQAAADAEKMRAGDQVAPNNVNLSLAHESYEEEEGALADIRAMIGDDLDNFDTHYRTVVHGFEDKVLPGTIGRILKDRNEKGWILVESEQGGEAHWVPSWVMSRGFYRATADHQGVMADGDLVEYLKGPIEGWCLVRNVTRGEVQADWVLQASLPDDAVEVKPRRSQGPVVFNAYHDYTSKDGKVSFKKGAELQQLSDPTRGWVQVLLLGSNRKVYAPYWVLPHSMRPAKDEQEKKPAEKKSAREVVGDTEDDGDVKESKPSKETQSAKKTQSAIQGDFQKPAISSVQLDSTTTSQKKKSQKTGAKEKHKTTSQVKR
ncbi:unnamed protein product [Amoebophrya sp. A25]|nr:unnamed protein product [Amoebophrya sp. A25]|eukprot:GSA25T00015122001.1